MAQIGPVFLPVAGIFAAIPYIGSFVQAVLEPFSHNTRFEPSIIASSLVYGDLIPLWRTAQIQNEHWKSLVLHALC